MNKDIIKGNWEQMKGKIRQQWAKLTDDDIEMIQGKSEELRGRLQAKYGYTKEEAEREMERMLEQNRDPRAS